MKKQGFTLVELLAVIAILSLLVIIALPNIIEMYKDAKLRSFLTECKQIFKSAEQQWMSDSMFETKVQEYTRCKTCTGKSLSLSGRTEISYYIKLNKSGKVVKFYATDGTYQYMYDGDDLLITAITDATEVATLNDDDKVEIANNIAYPVTTTDPSLFTYYNEPDGLVITGYSAIGPKDVVIPSYIDGQVVIALNDNAFESMGLNSVVLPKTLKHINGYDTNGVFYNNNLTSIVLPEGLETIGDGAFCNNNITSVIIPSTVNQIGGAAFAENKLKTVTLNNTGYISYNSFGGNEIEQIIFGSSAKDIHLGDSAFRNNKITNLVIPESVKSISDQTFAWNGMKTLSIMGSETTFRASSFIFNEIETLYVNSKMIPTYAFSTMGGGSGGHLKTLTLGESVQVIGNFSFNGNDLTTVTIPNSVTDLGQSALGANELRSIIIKGKNSSSEFSSTWYTGDKGWASDVTCVKDNKQNVENGCIIWGA